MKVWTVESATQECHCVCRVFALEEDAERYAATAREWVARQSQELPGEQNWDSRWPEIGYYRTHFMGAGHRTDLVDEAKASLPMWPFGEDNYYESFDVCEYDLTGARGQTNGGYKLRASLHDDRKP